VNDRAAAEGLRITILGSSSSIPRADRACSAYLIEGAGRAVIADMGTGSLSNLHRYRLAETIDAVVISHMHADHFLDVVPMRYALKYGPRSNGKRVRLLLPPGGEAMLRRLCDSFFRETADDFLDVFSVCTYDPAGETRVGDLRLRFAPGMHYIPTFAMRCTLDGISTVYSADTAPAEQIVALGRKTDLFLCEATLAPAELEFGARGHSSAAEAGAMARDGEMRKLVLTHYPSHMAEAELSSEARTQYGGEVLVADDHSQFDVGGS
jgi:ribonuclease BN (tRNA processing enzyme)